MSSQMRLNLSFVKWWYKTYVLIFSEYGESWHKGGIFANKQNVFDDFQCAAEYLISNKYTTPER